MNIPRIVWTGVRKMGVNLTKIRAVLSHGRVSFEQYARMDAMGAHVWEPYPGVPEEFTQAAALLMDAGTEAARGDHPLLVLGSRNGRY